MSGTSVATTASRSAPRVSVVLCTHNGAQYLDLAIRSILRQTVADLELIAVDDGSTDDTPAILARHAEEDARVRISRTEHLGLAEARNHGLDLARSNRVALMDDDDIAAPGRLERQLGFLDANRDVRALGTWAWQVGASGRRVAASDIGPTTREELARLRAEGLGVYLIAPSVVLDRDAVRAVGGFRQWMFPAEDIDLWLRLSDDGVVLALPERLLDYRVHARSVSSLRFMDQMTNILLARENARRRVSGQAELRPEEHRALLQADSRWRRWQRARVWRARYLYRMAGARLVDRQLTGALWLAAAAALAPLMVVRRLRRQVGGSPTVADPTA